MLRASIAAGVAVVGLALLLADRGFSQQEKTEPPPTKVKGQLPTYWSKIGLTDAQKQKVYETRATFGGKIDALNVKIKKLKAEEKAELEKILTEDQKTALRRIIAEKGPKATPPPPVQEEKKPGK